MPWMFFLSDLVNRGLNSGGEVAGLERRVGLIDDLEALFGVLVAAMRVGMVELDQFLVARFQARQGHRRLEIEHRERPSLWRSRVMVALGAVLVPARLGIVLEAEQAVIIEAGGIAVTQARTERPSGTLPHRIVADLLFDLVHAHTDIVIPRSVVSAHMVEAEPIELVQGGTRARCAKFTGCDATGVIAGAQIRVPGRTGMTSKGGT